MISKLKQACGFEYTNKLQRMFQVLIIEKEIITEYLAHTDHKIMFVFIYIMLAHEFSGMFRLFKSVVEFE